MVYRDEEVFDRSILLGEMFQCPEKGESALYDKDEMFWKD